MDRSSEYRAKRVVIRRFAIGALAAGSVVMFAGAMPLAVFHPWFWAALAVICGASSVGAVLRRRRPAAVRSREEYVGYFTLPILMLPWTLLLGGSTESEYTGWQWQDDGIFFLLGLQVMLAAWLLVRHRARLATATATAILGVWWAFGAAFVAYMAVNNDWL